MLPVAILTTSMLVSASLNRGRFILLCRSDAPPRHTKPSVLAMVVYAPYIVCHLDCLETYLAA